MTSLKRQMKVSLKRLGAAALAIGLSVGVAEAADDVTLTFVGWGGSFQDAETKAWLEPFMQANPHIKIVQDSPTDYAKLKAMVSADAVTWDIVDVAGDFGLESDEEYLTKIDCAVVACDKLQPDKFKTTGYRVPNSLGTVILSYNTEKMPQGATPQGWADFFDLERFPGKRAVLRSMAIYNGILEAALLADGVAPADLYPLDVPRALKKIDTIKDDIVFWETGQQCPEFVASGEAVMGLCWNGRVAAVQEQGLPIAMQWNQVFLQGEYFVIPKGAPHAAEAMQLIAYITSADNNHKLANYIPYPPANIDSIGMIDASVQPYLPTNFLDDAVAQDESWWQANAEAVSEQWQEWLQK